MKIVNKLALAGLSRGSFGLALGLLPLTLSVVQAADAPMPPLTPPPAMTAAAPAPTPMPAPIPLPPSPVAMPGAEASGASITHSDSTKAMENDITKTLSSAEDRATDNAKSVMKKLDESSDVTTLEDLNKAHQAIARLDAMIEIEKHLGDLEKARGDRGSHSLASAIPASALTPPQPSFAPPMPVMPSMPMPHMTEELPKPIEPPRPSFSNIEISRITGTDGKYVAVLKVAGENKTVRVGDQVSGATVRAISSSSVQIEENGSTRSLHVKNVDVVYSAMR